MGAAASTLAAKPSDARDITHLAAARAGTARPRLAQRPTATPFSTGARRRAFERRLPDALGAGWQRQAGPGRDRQQGAALTFAGQAGRPRRAAPRRATVNAPPTDGWRLRQARAAEPLLPCSGALR